MGEYGQFQFCELLGLAVSMLACRVTHTGLLAFSF
jgi:hypothetical protein